MDLKGQTKFLGLTGFGGTNLFSSLYRFMQSQSRYSELGRKIIDGDFEGVPYRVHEWLKRFRNVFTWLVTRCMIRHEKSLVFCGRESLLILPAAKVEVVRVELTATQRAAYKLLYKFACKRFEAFKASGDAVRKTIEVLQLLVPLRQACSIDTIDIDVVKRQLRDIARGIALGGPAVGGASAASAAFPQATLYAYGTLQDECTICLDMLEDAVQTVCSHIFCKVQNPATTERARERQQSRGLRLTRRFRLSLVGVHSGPVREPRRRRCLSAMPRAGHPAGADGAADPRDGRAQRSAREGGGGRGGH